MCHCYIRMRLKTNSCFFKVTHSRSCVEYTGIKWTGGPMEKHLCVQMQMHIASHKGYVAGLGWGISNLIGEVGIPISAKVSGAFGSAFLCAKFRREWKTANSSCGPDEYCQLVSLQKTTSILDYFLDSDVRVFDWKFCSVGDRAFISSVFFKLVGFLLSACLKAPNEKRNKRIGRGNVRELPVYVFYLVQLIWKCRDVFWLCSLNVIEITHLGGLVW